MRRNQEVVQFGPWLRANSPTRRGDKGQDRYADKKDSSKDAQPAARGWTRREAHAGERRAGRNRRTRDSGDEDQDGGDCRDSFHPRSSDKGSEFGCGNRGDINEPSWGVSQQNKEGGFVGDMRNIFENQSSSFNERDSKTKDGKNNVGVMNDKHVENSPNGKRQRAPAGVRNKGKRALSPHDKGSDGKFTKKGSPYSGPVFADIIRSVQEAQSGSPIPKRKNRDEETDHNEVQLYRRKIRVTESEEKTSGQTSSVGLDGEGVDCNNGSGIAEAGIQPRRPQ
jgi:hypothetical protein